MGMIDDPKKRADYTQQIFDMSMAGKGKHSGIVDQQAPDMSKFADMGQMQSLMGQGQQMMQPPQQPGPNQMIGQGAPQLGQYLQGLMGGR